ncbi:replication initiation factor domain-containing protein [Enterococcus sp. DIV0187]|uniref:replication initiation factor domain-containing protein n=1 Tax=Enterococcus sp. DIV0187 TaxID=2774644 RepID=UPI003F6879AA
MRKSSPKELRNYRYKFGLRNTKTKKVRPVSQRRFAEIVGVSLSYYQKMEQGKRPIPEEIQERLEAYFRIYLKHGMDMRVMIDYLRLSFFGVDPKEVIRTILGMNELEFETRSTGLYLFDQVSVRGNIWVFWHTKESTKNVLVQFSGQGCREYEELLKERKTNWQDFLLRIWQKQGMAESCYDRVQCSRIDIAIDELWLREDEEHFDLFSILEKKPKGLLEDRFKLFENYGGYVTESDVVRNKGLSLYFGSRKSPLYFIFYEKRLEIASREKMTEEEALLDYGIFNRYEIRCAAERAMDVISQFITGTDLGVIGAGIINSRITVYDLLDSEAKIVNKQWAQMFRTARELNFTMKAEKFSLERAERWFEGQVAPTLKLLKLVDELTGRDFVDATIEKVELSADQENYLAWFQSSGGDQVGG